MVKGQNNTYLEKIANFVNQFIGIALFMACVFFTLSTFLWHYNFPFYYWFGLWACYAMVIATIINKKIYYVKNIWINLMYVGIFLSLIPAYVCKDLPVGYYQHSRIEIWNLLVYYFLIGYIQDNLDVIIEYTFLKKIKESKVFNKIKILASKYTFMDIVRIGFMFTCLIQILYIPIQFLIYNIWGIDLNNYIFVEIFHRKYLVSMRYRLFNDVVKVAPSGFTPHSSQLGPMFVLGLLLFNNIWVRLLIVFDALVCRNTTSILCVIATIGLLILFGIIRGEITYTKIKKWILSRKVWQYALAAMLFVLAIIFIFQTNAIKRITDEIGYMITRFRNFFTKDSNSQEIHVAYFKYGIIEWLKTSPLRKILGVGYWSSGYLLEQYNSLLRKYPGSAVECDFINILLSNGVVGFITYYSFLIVNSIKSLKIDYKIFIFMVTVIACGACYNIQWDYTLFIEMIFMICLINKKKFFK